MDVPIQMSINTIIYRKNIIKLMLNRAS